MKQNNSKSIVFGVLALAAGALLMGFNLGLLPAEYKQVMFSWPVLLMALGLITLFSRRNKFLGVMLLLLGAISLFPRLLPGSCNPAGMQNGWALGLMFGGIYIVYKTIRKRSSRCCPAGECAEAEPCAEDAAHRRNRPHEGPGYIDRNCIFSGSKEKISIKNFRGGEINSIFGGFELDLSEAELAEGTHHLELNSVFGGIVLYLPVDWNVEIRKQQVFGQFVDHRPKIGFEVDEKSTLIIEASSVFGGGEIKCK